MSNKSTDLESFTEKSAEEIFEEIIQYLRNFSSDYFEYNPREPIEEPIIRAFKNCSNESLKNRMRKAIYLCVVREEFFQDNPDYIISVLNMIEEMMVTQAKNYLLGIINTNTFSKISSPYNTKIKIRIFLILLKFDISQKELKDIIDNNIQNPEFTEICFQASLKLTPKIKHFKDNFPKAILAYKSNPEKVNLRSLFRTSLYEIGESSWEKIGADILRSNFEEFHTIYEIFSDAGLSPKIIENLRDDNFTEFSIIWPYTGEERITVYFNFSSEKKEIISNIFYEKSHFFLERELHVNTFELNVRDDDEWKKIRETNH